MPFSNGFQIPNVNLILIAAAIIIAVLVVIFVLYRIVYKVYVNRVLAQGRHSGKSHSPMITPGALLVATGIVAGIAVSLTVICMINILYAVDEQSWEYILQTYREQFVMEQKFDRTQIASVYSFEVGKTHADTQTVDLTLTLQTNLTLGKNDKLTFRIGDSKTQLKEDESGNYVGTVQASAFKASPSGILTLESDGEKISQILANSPLLYESTVEYDAVNGDEWRSFYPYAECYVSTYDYDGEDGQKRLSRLVTVCAHAAEDMPERTFDELKLMIEQDGTRIREIDLMTDKTVKFEQQDNSYTYELNEPYKDCELKYYLFAKDTNDNHYEMYFWMDQKPGGDNEWDDSDFYCRITDKKGNLYQHMNLY